MTVRSLFGSNNASGADNQQERLLANRLDPDQFGWYLAGFADGEGSFNVSLKKRNYGIGWKVELSFNISQRDASLLYQIQHLLGCGTVRFRKDGVGCFETRSFGDLKNTIIPFFKTYPLLSKKQYDFQIFCQIAQLVFSKQHLTYQGMKQLLELRENMNGGGKRKYTPEQILKTMRVESSETIRQTPL